MCVTNSLLFVQLNDKYHELVADSERDQFIAKLREVKDWIYKDGEDETKGLYIAKLEELKKVMHFSMLLFLQVDYVWI